MFGVHFLPPFFADAFAARFFVGVACPFVAATFGFGVGPGLVFRFIAAAKAAAVITVSRPNLSDSISPLTTICRTRAGVTPKRAAASFVVNRSVLMRRF